MWRDQLHGAYNYLSHYRMQILVKKLVRSGQEVKRSRYLCELTLVHITHGVTSKAQASEGTCE